MYCVDYLAGAQWFKDQSGIDFYNIKFIRPGKFPYGVSFRTPENSSQQRMVIFNLMKVFGNAENARFFTGECEATPWEDISQIGLVNIFNQAINCDPIDDPVLCDVFIFEKNEERMLAGVLSSFLWLEWEGVLVNSRLDMAVMFLDGIYVICSGASAVRRKAVEIFSDFSNHLYVDNYIKYVNLDTNNWYEY